MKRGQIYGGAFMIAAGVGSILGHLIGFDKVWFIYPLVAGILMMVVPAEGADLQKTRTVGVWVALGGAVSGLVVLTGLSWAVFSPVYLVAAGVMMLIKGKRANA